ncbi:Gfo/Idh/MocA family oxidoreductase [Halobacillus salinarum]|uniref:Gfo/Idh/MocA family oxidoreductase n=1 Tax=Halobacillus salinarum TaxID=2932257 RepID=A0ABY4EJ69_9BACI|nr:Gfo/Idh/MocA family oxidoreductase [Halobacillus salinarum]UOQ43893.1 Gfo/Idh/MocA family oxidoreductase [Halobacillus salinarum]
MVYSVVIVGAGIIAEEHMRSLLEVPEVEVTAVADINEEKVEAMRTRYAVTGYLDYKEMVKKEMPDIAIITLPHFLHKEAAVFCACQGVHLLLEKPMAVSTSDCQEIIDASTQVHVLVGHIQHYFAENIKAKALIKSGQLGRLIMVNETRFMNYFVSERPSWFLEKEKSGGGVVMNLGAHSIDKIQWMLDTNFSSVISKLSYESEQLGIQSNVEGSSSIWLKTKEGLPVTISISGYHGPPTQITEFVFTNGILKVELGKGVWISQYDNFEQIPVPDHPSPFVLQFYELLNAVTKKEELENSGLYGQSIVKVIEAVYQSDKEGGLIHIL